MHYHNHPYYEDLAMSKKKKSPKQPQFRTDVTKFAHAIWVVSHGRYPARQDLHAATSRAEAQAWIDDQPAMRGRYLYIGAQHVIFMCGRWWRVSANPLNVKVPLPPIPFVHPAAPKVEPLPLTATRTYTWPQRLRILFTGQITVTAKEPV